MSTWQDAVDKRKLRLEWGTTPDGAPLPRDAVLDALWSAIRQRHESPATSQDELLTVLGVEAADGGVRITARYVFDRDFAAMYDQTETYDVEVLTDASGVLASIDRWDRDQTD